MERNTKTDRIEKLKSYLRRLGEGESLDAVRKDFALKFQGVEASEIMKAEEAILAEGTPITEVQKLCDVHSALFHGATDYSNKHEKSAALSQVKGHPLQTFTRENESLTKLIDRMKECICGTSGAAGSKSLPADEKQAGKGSLSDEIPGLLLKIREVAVHYAKKGDLLYPHLNARYGIAGPSAVMWTADDEIRDELGALCKALQKEKETAERNAADSKKMADGPQWDAKWLERLKKVLLRAEEMIYKENHILFPNCAVNFTEEDWMGIYRDAKDYTDCFGVHGEVWEEAEIWLQKAKEAGRPFFKGETDRQTPEGITGRTESRAADNLFTEGVIGMPGGHLTLQQLTALLNTIPLEISFIDAADKNCYFNEGPKVFKRAQMAIDRSVFTCHPPKVEAMVRRIIGEFRAGTLDKVPVWMDKGGRTMLVTYLAVRDEEDSYIGTVELVQDMEFAKEHFCSKS